MIGDLLLRLLIIYVLILTGIILKWLIRRDEALIKVISFLLVYLLMPVVVFTSITQFSETFEDYRVMLFSASIFFLSSVVAYIFLRASKQNENGRAPVFLTSINPNGFYLPFPIVYALYGVEGFTYSTVYLFIANIASAFYIFPLYSYYSINHRKSADLIRRILLFPPLIASVLGFILLGFGFKFPNQLTQPSSYIGQLTTYTALLFVGLNISVEWKKWLSRPILKVAAIRLLIVPLIMLVLMKSQGLNDVWNAVIIIHSGMPPAVNNIILANYFGLDKKLVATIVTEVTALTLFTLPLLLYLVQSL